MRLHRLALLLVAIAFISRPAARAADSTTATTNTLVIHADAGEDTISRNLYGQFTEHLGHCVYDGIWVGENSSIPNTRGIRNDVVAALKTIQVPVIRWPGGCFADQYHWMDGIGPRSQRPKRINTTWGGVTEDNQFGTHEFLDFCEQIGASPYISANVGSGTVQEMMDWIEYMTATTNSSWSDLRRQNGREKPWRIPFVGVGNESWGCGGAMTPEFYADNFRRYNEFVKNFPGNKIYRIASGANGDDTNWTTVMMHDVGTRMNGLSLHYYTLVGEHWPPHGSATQFDEAQWFAVMKNAWHIDDIITRHSAIMDRYDPQRKVGLIVDEWGTWYEGEPGSNPAFLYQQNTLRDALVAGMTLNIFNNHCARVKMACIAQLANVLQAMVLTDGPKMTVTPSYWVFDMYLPHHDATLLPSDLQSANYEFNGQTVPTVSASASRDQSGKIHVTLCNLNPDGAATVTVQLQGAKARKISGRILTAPEMNAHNTFDHPDTVKPAKFTGFKATEDGFNTTLPPKSVVALEVE
ncbi:MAG TPA: alpha-N-arabinofuranosidase [Verrucomicrobiae bacterium]|nr:alpha-N-arabinofuranosidase [Verrucomicrobiae bacterium]